MSQATLKQRSYLIDLYRKLGKPLEEIAKVRDMSFDEASKCIGAAKDEIDTFGRDADREMIGDDVAYGLEDVGNK
jgi:hypothetical protein